MDGYVEEEEVELEVDLDEEGEGEEEEEDEEEEELEELSVYEDEYEEEMGMKIDESPSTPKIIVLGLEYDLERRSRSKYNWRIINKAL